MTDSTVATGVDIIIIIVEKLYHDTESQGVVKNSCIIYFILIIIIFTFNRNHTFNKHQCCNLTIRL